MKRYLFILCWLLASWDCLAQADITAMEYFVDDDPGVGMGMSVDVTSGQSVDINFTVPVSSLSLAAGYHLLGIRTRNSAGVWSNYEIRKFYIQEVDEVPTPTVSDIVSLEYYVDEDPGIGDATSIVVSQGQTIDQGITIPTSSMSLQSGFHIVGIRVKNADGKWSIHERRVFYIQESESVTPTPASDIVSLEYFINEDPGIGQGTEIDISSGVSIDLATLTTAAALGEGFHVIGVRAKNADNQWGFTEVRKFYIDGASVSPDPISNIVKLEYFVDDDPGFDQGTEIEVSPATTFVDIANIDIPLGNGLTIGTHTFTVRAKNDQNKWSINETREFDIDGDCPIASFDVEVFCAEEAVLISDLSTEPTGIATYQWYADGLPISTDIGDISHVFQNSGSHTISLAIDNGMTCMDSTGMTITVKPKPIVVFHAEQVEVGNPTNYIVDQFNVTGSTWSWDFDNDGTEDDTTEGNTSFTFETAGTYTTVLTIEDGLGCGTSYTRDVVVTEELIQLTANFTSSNSCAGDPTYFSDLSSGAETATYSWDFDTDGTEDATTVGDAEFTYATAGSYTASLTVELAGGATSTIAKEVVVIENPAALFSFGNACVNSPVAFTNDSDQISDEAIFQWDFDGDGQVDSNDSESITFTYSESGTYPVTLVVDNGSGCYDVFVKNIQIDPAPVADFTYTHSTNGNGDVAFVQFENKSEGIDFAWTFGDDETSMDKNPLHEFDNYKGQTFEVCLTASNNCNDIQVCQSIIFTVTGLNDELNGISIFPNPSYGEVYMQFADSYFDASEVIIYTLNGKILRSFSIDPNKINEPLKIDKLSSGSYMVKVIANDESITKKLVIR